jgi:hypothetical protein
MLLELQDDRQERQASLDLFDEPEQKQQDDRGGLMQALDALSERFGRDAGSPLTALHEKHIALRVRSEQTLVHEFVFAGRARSASTVDLE